MERALVTYNTESPKLSYSVNKYVAIKRKQETLVFNIFLFLTLRNIRGFSFSFFHEVVDKWIKSDHEPNGEHEVSNAKVDQVRSQVHVDRQKTGKNV